jgi:ArsR family transcriptional regulator
MGMLQSLEILKALSDMNRLRIVAALSRYEELCACQITELLQVTGATVSRHLSVLQHAGLLESRKEGRWIYYHLVVSVENASLFGWLETDLDGSGKLKDDQQALESIVEITREDLCRRQRGEECCPK